MPSEHNDEYLLNLSLPCVRDFGDMILVLRGVNSFLLSASSALTITCSTLDELTCLALHRNLAMWGQVDCAISFGCRPRVPSGG